MHDGKAFDEIDMCVRLIQSETHPRPMDSMGTLLAMVKIFGEQVAVLRDMVVWRR